MAHRRSAVEVATVLLTAVLILSACGGGSSKKAAPSTGVSGTSSAITATAIDIGWKQKQLSARAGHIEVTLVNDGQIPHAFVIEGLEKDLLLEVDAHGATRSGTINIRPGTYTFYCNVPGHRQAKMEGTLTVS